MSEHKFQVARLEPIAPCDEKGLPRAWRVVSSRQRELRWYPGSAKATAETFVTEFNIKAYDVARRLRTASPWPIRAFPAA
jgi:hypothetical protein